MVYVCTLLTLTNFSYYVVDDKERDVWVDLTKIGTMTNVRGSLHLKFQWRGGSHGHEGEEDHETDALLGKGEGGGVPNNDFMTSTGNQDPEFASQPPNELRIIIVQGRNLLAMDTGMYLLMYIFHWIVYTYAYACTYITHTYIYAHTYRYVFVWIV